MTTPRYILALDQGTTSSRAILFDREGRPVGQQGQEFPQLYPQPGWVSHDPLAIWESQLAVTKALLAQHNVEPDEIAAIGITNQRETTVIWDAATGEPIADAIVWQCRRTTPLCDALRAAGWAEPIREKTGLVLDPYFSGTKVKWLLDNVPGARARAERGELRFGTIDSWLIWKLTGGKVHVTDYSNASRTMLFNIKSLEWDSEILAELQIPRSLLPAVTESSLIYGETDPALFGAPIPISGCAGDQQAALFGQGCFEPGEAKNTYGTGCFMLMQTGEKAVPSQHGLLTTIAWGLGGKIEYALEGSIFVAGAAIQWLRDELQIIERADETEALARSIPDTGGVYLVPAFVGLGAPHWDAYARGSLVGLTRGSGRAQIARAALESIAYQTRDLLDSMQADSGIQLQALRVDGGAVRNDFLMQFQADMLNVPVDRPTVNETTALGAAYLAGLAVGFWSDQAELRAKWQRERRFLPEMPEAERTRFYRGWQRAIERSRAWAEE